MTKLLTQVRHEIRDALTRYYAECGSEELYDPAAPLSKRDRKELLLRFGIASSVGLAVSSIAIVGAWLEAREGYRLSKEQFLTRLNLRNIDSAVKEYQQYSNVPPPSLQALQQSSNHGWLKNAWLDGWHQPFLYLSNANGVSVISYGRDGRPGGVGLDCDLTNDKPFPKESFPTFVQFLRDVPTEKMTGTCMVSGILAFIISIYTVRKPDLTYRGIIFLLIKLGALVIGAATVAIILSVLHIPTGH